MGQDAIQLDRDDRRWPYTMGVVSRPMAAWQCLRRPRAFAVGQRLYRRKPRHPVLVGEAGEQRLGHFRMLPPGQPGDCACRDEAVRQRTLITGPWPQPCSGTGVPEGPRPQRAVASRAAPQESRLPIDRKLARLVAASSESLASHCRGPAARFFPVT